MVWQRSKILEMYKFRAMTDEKDDNGNFLQLIKVILLTKIMISEVQCGFIII